MTVGPTRQYCDAVVYRGADIGSSVQTTESKQSTMIMTRLCGGHGLDYTTVAGDEMLPLLDLGELEAKQAKHSSFSCVWLHTRISPFHEQFPNSLQ